MKHVKGKKIMFYLTLKPADSIQNKHIYDLQAP